MYKKKIYYIAIIILLLAGIFYFRSYSNPLGIIGRFFYDRQDVDETIINVKGTTEGLLAQTEEMKFYLSSLGNEILYTTDKDSEESSVEWGEIYKNGDMVFAWSIKTENYLLALGQNYDPKFYGHEGPLKEGLVGRYNGAVLEFIDLKTGDVVKEHKFEEILLYAGDILKTEKFKGYESGQEYIVVQEEDALELYIVNENGAQEYLQSIVLHL